MMIESYQKHVSLIVNDVDRDDIVIVSIATAIIVQRIDMCLSDYKTLPLLLLYTNEYWNI